MDVSNQSTAAAPEPAEKGPRARTMRLLLETAVQLMQSGVVPSVSDVAEAAEVSRATAYRYFPSQAALVSAVVDEALGPILDWRSDLADPGERVADLLETSLPRLDEFEASFRAALQLSLEQWAKSRVEQIETEARFKRGHRIELLRRALAPLRGRVDEPVLKRLTMSLSLIFGVEGLIVFKDIWGADEETTREVLVWAARQLVAAAGRTAWAGMAGSESAQ